jgi:hypothetical protein
MKLQNRVAPTGEILAVPARGTLMGNRGGPLHGAGKSLRSRRWATRQWICCRLDFNGRQREIMAPGRYTELFFLDEATALAAGHRPCFECRRADAVRFADAWRRAHAQNANPRAADIDRALHAQRLDARGGKQLHTYDVADLPAGAFVLDHASARPHLVQPCSLLPWTFTGYGPPQPRPRHGPATALTPPGIIGALKFGYVPMVHVSARISG